MFTFLCPILSVVVTADLMTSLGFLWTLQNKSHFVLPLFTWSNSIIYIPIECKTDKIILEIHRGIATMSKSWHDFFFQALWMNQNSLDVGFSSDATRTIFIPIEKLLETRASAVCSASVGWDTCHTVPTAAVTESISLHDNCQCVLSGRFIAPEFGVLTRKEGSPSPWKWADTGLKLTALQCANFLCLFICFLMTPHLCQEGFFFCVKKWKK